MYNELAKYYDALVKDEEATKMWVDFIEAHIQGNEIMELACGSGEITLSLAKKGYQMDASDLSIEMIQEAKAKDKDHLVNYYPMDMTKFHIDKMYDGILCLCDSINYLIELEDIKELFHNVYKSLKTNGVFIFDMHSLDRLDEFKEEFFEAGVINKHEYTWSITSEEDYIYHNFMFYDEDANVSMEQHIQRVYDPIQIKNILLDEFDTVSIYTDFTETGIKNGEKYFYVCKKRG